MSAIGMPPEISRLNPDPWTQPFWDAAREHRLVAARCTGCATWRPTPPGPACWECAVTEVEWVELSGRGEVHTYTVVHGGVMPSLQALAPYVIAIISLAETTDVRLMAVLTDVEVDDVTVGRPVTVWWDDIDAGTTVPRFRPSPDEGRHATKVI